MKCQVFLIFFPFCYCTKRSEFQKKMDLGYRSLDGVSVPIRSAVECAALCMHQNYCSSWYYNNVSMSCNIDTHYAVTPVTDPQNEWMFYEIVVDLYNVAKNKLATQSSVISDDYIYKSAGHAVDGYVPRAADGLYCAYTERDNPSWWQVDLQLEYRIHKVNLVNRNDDVAVGQRLRNLDVDVITATGQTLLCGHFAHTSVIGETIELMCTNKPKGRYVKVTLREVEYLTLCEVEVFTWA